MQGWKGTALRAAEKRSNAVIVGPFVVILSTAKSLALPFGLTRAKDHA